MTARRSGSAAASIREDAGGAARRRPRELYDAGPPPDSDAPVDSTSPDVPFRGEFEQRARGPEGTGQAGRFGSDASVREQLCQRIADDPRLAGTQVELVVDTQALTLSGDIADPAVRDRLLEHARALGISEIHDSLRVVKTRVTDRK
jgi:hypothetical protein